MSKKYLEVAILIEPFEPELIYGFLWELNPSGAEEKEDCILAYFDEQPNLKDNLKGNLENLKLANLIRDYRIFFNEIEDKNWNEEWEKSIRVIEVGNKFVIKPSFKDYDNKQNRLILHIDPKMSFGTGEHITTRMCLEFLEKNIYGNELMLDCGTGTGILAIAAIKLGARYAIAFDIDEWSYLNAKENFEANGVADKISLRLGNFDCVSQNEKDFDIIVANIVKPILKEKTDFFNQKLKKGGKLAISGFLNSDIVELNEIYENYGFELIEQKSQSDWALLAYIKS